LTKLLPKFGAWFFGTQTQKNYLLVNKRALASGKWQHVAYELVEISLPEMQK